jgi:hypothetical protein
MNDSKIRFSQKPDQVRNFKQDFFVIYFNLIKLNEFFLNICRFSLGNVWLRSYEGSKYLNYSVLQMHKKECIA